MKRTLKFIAAGLVLVLVLVGGLVTYLVSTTGGAGWLLNLTAASSGMVLQWEQLQGSLLDGIDAEGITGSSSGTTWTLRQLRLRWQPRLLRSRRLVIDELTANGLALRTQSTSSGEPLTAEGLQASLFGLPVAVEIRQLRISDFILAGESPFTFETLTAAVSLDNTRLVIDQLDFRSETTMLSGQAQLEQSLSLSGNINWQFQQPERDYSGTLELGGSLQELAINHVLGSPLQLTSRGTLQPALFANDMLRFDLQHEFPLQTLAIVDRPDTSFSGNLRTAGNAGGGSFDTEVQLTGTVQNYPVALNGRVSRRANATLDIDVDASSESNMLLLTGSLGQTLDLDWQIQAPDLTELLPTLSGSLTGEGHLGGTRELPEVSGTLNGQQLGYEQDGNRFLLDTLVFTANYGAQGNDMQFQLGTLTRQGAGGAATLLQSANVTATGTPAQHTASATIVSAPGELQVDLRGTQANEVWTETFTTASLRSRQYGNWDIDAPVELRYAPEGVSVSRHCWDYGQLSLCVAGEIDAERRVDAQLTLNGLSLAWLNAGIPAADKPLALQQWQDDAGIYMPEGLTVSGRIDVALQTRDLSDLRNGSMDLMLTPQDVELQWVPVDAEQPELLRQHLALTVNDSELHLQQGAWTANVDVDVAREQEGSWLPQGNLRGEGGLDADDRVDATLVFDFRDLSWLETAVPLLRETAGTITGLATVTGERTQPNLQLQMQLADGQFDVPEYGLQIRNVALDMTTAADESLRITGSAGSGPGSLAVNAEVRMPLLPERQVIAELNGDNFLVIDTASARSHLNSSLRLDYSQEAIVVNGELELFSADFDLETLFRSASEGAIPVSNDVVIVRGAPEDAGAVTDNDVQIPIALDMTVKVGESVHVHGYDLDATLAGELSLRQTPGQSLLVYGELGIPEGRYQIYNQQLNAKDGRLMFFGNAANPVLDLRAFRTTSSAEVGVWLNGALSEVRGELYSTPALPDSEILSLLVTGKSFGDVNAQENDALLGAVASLGLRRSQGLTDRVGSTLGLDSLTLGGESVNDSALGLGKYLTPNLLMRYKVGLFDRQSVLAIEYMLNEHVKLKVESGISQSLELSYTIEKD